MKEESQNHQTVEQQSADQVEQKQRQLEALRHSFREFSFEVGKRDWKREDLYERGKKDPADEAIKAPLRPSGDATE